MTRFQSAYTPLSLSLVFFVLIFPASSFAETLYVKSANTKLRFSDKVKTSILGVLNKGTAVQVMVKSRRFYKVILPNGQKGWVFKFKLAKKALVLGGDENSGFADILPGNQISTYRSSSSSIRGLSPISVIYAKRKGIPMKNIEAVGKMEAYKTDFAELESFLKEGKLGENSP